MIIELIARFRFDRMLPWDWTTPTSAAKNHRLPRSVCGIWSWHRISAKRIGGRDWLVKGRI